MTIEITDRVGLFDWRILNRHGQVVDYGTEATYEAAQARAEKARTHGKRTLGIKW